MKLLLISALTQPMPYDGYAPVENHVYHVGIQLKERGHETSIVALKGSQLAEGIELMEAQDGDEEKAYSLYKDRLGDFDCVLDFSNLKYSYLFKHDEAKDLRLIGCVYPYQGQGYKSAPPIPFPCFVGTSDAHAQSLSLRFGVATRVVYYGVAGSNPGQRGDRMIYLGRFMKEKGPQIAVDVARQLRIGLDLVGEDVAVPDQRFLIQLLQRCDGRLVRSYGRVKEETKHELLSKAKCALLPYLSDDVAYACLPAIEALAHGVPVVALRKGAIPEIVQDGVNGFIADRTDQMAEAVQKVDSISPEACMESAKSFSLENSIVAYEKLVKELVDEGVEW